MQRCERNLDRLQGAVAQGDAWHAEHDWRHGRLAAIETELVDLGHIDLLRTISLPERTHGLARDRSRASGSASRLGRDPLGGNAGEVPPWRADRLAEIAAPPLPGRDAGLGMDLGL